jgi:hypothetical protein
MLLGIAACGIVVRGWKRYSFEPALLVMCAIDLQALQGCDQGEQ